MITTIRWLGPVQLAVAVVCLWLLALEVASMLH